MNTFIKNNYQKIKYLLLLLLAILILLICNQLLEKENEGFIPITETYPLSRYNTPPEGFYRVDLSFVAIFPLQGHASTLPQKGVPGIKIPDGYYEVDIDGTSMMAEVPFGYTVGMDKKSIYPIGTIIDLSGNTISNSKSLNDNNSKYDFNNYNVQYHDTINDLTSQGSYGVNDGNAFIYDSKGNKIILPNTNSKTTPTYYTPGSFIFGSSNYVPTYEDSVFLTSY